MELEKLMSRCDVLLLAAHEIESVEPEMVERYAAKLSKPCAHETPLADLNTDTLRRMWVACKLLTVKLGESQNRLRNGALTPDEEKSEREEFVRMAGIRDVLQQIFWFQVRQDCSAFAEPYIYVKAGWEVVTSPHPPAESLLSGLFGGLLGACDGGGS